MADVQVNVKVDAKEADESIKGLTRQLKQLREQQAKLPEGSAAWKKLGQDINDLEGRLGDLNDRFNTLRGSGVERLQSSFGLLREGLTSADFGKAKIALQGVGQAMSAIPIFLLIKGVQTLYENWDKVISVFKDFFNIQTESEKATKKLNDELSEQKEITKSLGSSLENEIRLLEAQGVSNDKIIAKKKELNALKIKELEIDNQLQKQKIQDALLNDNLTESTTRFTIALQRKLGNDKAADALEKALLKDKLERVKEEKDKIIENEIAIAKLKTDIVIDEIKNEKEKEKEAKKSYDEKKKLKEKEIEDSKKLADELFAELSKNQDTIDKQNAEARKRELDQKNKWYKDEKDIRNYWQKIAAEENAKIEKEVEDKAKEELEKKRQIRDAEFAIASASLNSLQSLSDTFFSIRLANLEEGSKKEQEVAKKQFNINKALAISSTLISGFQGVVNALTAKSTIPEPFGQALKVANAVSIGLATAANVAKISAQQFKATGGSTGGGGAPRTGGGNTPNVNTPTPPQAQLPNQQGTFIQDQRVYVLESDISKAQSRVTRVEEQARF